jgi:hypothetical protein
VKFRAVPVVLREEKIMYQNIDRLSQEASIGAEKMMERSVNWIDRPKDRFWCPGCQKNQSHPQLVAPWIGPDGKLVCFYLVCKRCGKSGVDTFRAGDRPLSQRKVDMVERSLLSRYPHIAENLPPNYFEPSEESEPEFLGNMIIPSPVQPSVDGRLPQVAYRKYLVIRFLAYLGLDRDAQCKLIWHLGESYPLVTVCSNGEEPEGYEAWFKVEGWTEEACRLFMEEACKFTTPDPPSRR